MRDETDAYLTAAFQDVPVPDGLEQRLLDCLAADTIEGESAGLSVLPIAVGGPEILVRPSADSNAAPPSSRLPPPSLAVGRQQFAGRGGRTRNRCLVGTHGERHLSERIVLDEAIQSFGVGSKASGRLLSEAPAEYPPSRMVRHSGATRWRPADGFLGSRGVVYDLAGPAGTHAALYVVDREVEGLRTAPTLHPFTTAGSSCCASAWQEGGLLYVLVVQGDRATYENYLKLPRSPVAMAFKFRVLGLQQPVSGGQTFLSVPKRPGASVTDKCDGQM